MMGSGKNLVFEFLENISASVIDKASRELDMLKELKHLDEGDLAFGMEDLPYYMNRAREQHFDLDFGVMKYFTINLVLSGIFKIGLRFEDIADADVWYPDVQHFAVFDLSSSELMGYFYLELYSRFIKFVVPFLVMDMPLLAVVLCCLYLQVLSQSVTPCLAEHNQSSAVWMFFDFLHSIYQVVF